MLTQKEIWNHVTPGKKKFTHTHIDEKEVRGPQYNTDYSTLNVSVDMMSVRKIGRILVQVEILGVYSIRSGMMKTHTMPPSFIKPHNLVSRKA